MSITDELRQYTKHYSVAGSKKDTMLSSIADRIDTEYEHVRAESIIDMTDERMAEHGWVRMPVDADGEPIHVGDWMTPNGMDTGFKVRQMHFNGEWSLDLEGFGISQTCPDMCHHHHVPTVEDVLEELLREYDRDDSELTNGEIIERYAAKLRLAGDAE